MVQLKRKSTWYRLRPILRKLDLMRWMKYRLSPRSTILKNPFSIRSQTPLTSMYVGLTWRRAGTQTQKTLTLTMASTPQIIHRRCRTAFTSVISMIRFTMICERHCVCQEVSTDHVDAHVGGKRRRGGEGVHLDNPDDDFWPWASVVGVHPEVAGYSPKPKYVQRLCLGQQQHRRPFEAVGMTYPGTMTPAEYSQATTERPCKPSTPAIS